jgi:hypothetical protein
MGSFFAAQHKFARRQAGIPVQDLSRTKLRQISPQNPSIRLFPPHPVDRLPPPEALGRHPAALPPVKRHAEGGPKSSAYQRVSRRCRSRLAPRFCPPPNSADPASIRKRHRASPAEHRREAGRCRRRPAAACRKGADTLDATERERVAGCDNRSLMLRRRAHSGILHPHPRSHGATGGPPLRPVLCKLAKAPLPERRIGRSRHPDELGLTSVGIRSGDGIAEASGATFRCSDASAIRFRRAIDPSYTASSLSPPPAWGRPAMNESCTEAPFST